MQSIVKKPRFTQHVHQVVAEGNTSLQKEVTLVLRHLPHCDKKTRAEQCRSAPIIPDAWQNRFFPESFSVPPGKGGQYKQLINYQYYDNYNRNYIAILIFKKVPCRFLIKKAS